MRLLRPHSLRWRLVQRITVTQIAILVVLCSLSIGVVSFYWISGNFAEGIDELRPSEVLADALRRDSAGHLILNPTKDLQRLRKEAVDLWFIIRDDTGETIREGIPPPEIKALLPMWKQLSYARITSETNSEGRAIGIVQTLSTPVGRIRVASGSDVKITFTRIIAQSGAAFRLTMYMALLMTLATIAATPFVVRRALKGLDQVAAEAASIDIGRSGTRLHDPDLPSEISPLLKAVNDALERLDMGYESHKRFLVDAAHELRTPIAILTTRLAVLPASPTKSRLLEDSARLTALAGQLLDLQRLDQQKIQLSPINLVALAERVVLDIAPLAFGAGYEMFFDTECDRVDIHGDETAVERALTNLIQNAIKYGGRQGRIFVRVAAAGWVEVCDEGSGIPEHQREQIFEAFHRLKHDGRGVGLGLDLVQKIMRMHGGRAEVVPSATRGACFRLVFPH